MAPRESHHVRRIPFIAQMTAVDCGAACLAMVLGYHGKTVDLQAVRDALGIARDGCTALDLANAAQWFGLRTRGVSLDIDDLDYLDRGAILHWKFSHFVVFDRLLGDSVAVVDPASGHRRVPMAVFRKSFTGVALLLEPGEKFAPSAAPQLASYLWRYARRVLGETGIWRRILLLSIVLQLFSLVIPAVTGMLVDKVVPHGDRDLLVVLGGGAAMLAGFFFIVSLVRSMLLLHLRTRLDLCMTLGFMDHLVDLPFAFFQQRHAGDLVMRVNSNAVIREVLTSSVLSGGLDGSLVVVNLLLLLAISPAMGALVVALGSLQVAVFILTRQRQKELAAANLETEARSQSYLVEVLNGFETLKSTGTELRAAEHWSDLFVASLNVSVQRGRLSAVIDSSLGVLRIANPLMVLGLGASLVLKGNLSLGTMLALNSVAMGLLGPLGGLVSTAMQLQVLRSYVDRIEDVLRTAPDQERGTARLAPRLSGEICLRNVSFAYGQGPSVVRNVSLEVAPGQFVAIVGRSGCGKSTLARLLLGLYRPTSGNVSYDGLDLSELDFRSIRRQLGIVTQSPHIFAGSVRSNIALSNPESSLDDVKQASRLAHIHDELDAMPLGYDTPLAEGGASLSGGQRQRLALARALVHKPSIVLLDEATSALDSVTERLVQAELGALRCTRIVIAHRLSTVARADQILVMRDGEVVERGRHEELIAARGAYATLVAAQLMRDERPDAAVVALH